MIRTLKRGQDAAALAATDNPDLTYRLAGLALKSITGYADFSAARSQDRFFGLHHRH